jgi:hypothetical protein
MYERDFASGLTNLRWRNVNDAGFFSRRAPYRTVGGFESSLGHFAEWVLAARYATEGFVVGQCPDIEMWHAYTGDVAGLRAFTEDFVRGEITYLARDPEMRREMLIAPPVEWSSRGDRRRDLSRARRSRAAALRARQLPSMFSCAPRTFSPRYASHAGPSWRIRSSATSRHHTPGAAGVVGRLYGATTT